MMPPDPPGHEINEFPFFTFLFADPHAHLLALPFTLVALGLALALVLGALRVSWGHARSGTQVGPAPGDLLILVALGLVVGSLRAINTWDYPTYLIVTAAAVFLAAYFRKGGLSLVVLLESGLKTALVFLVGYVAFLPYNVNYEAFFTGLEPTTNQTALWQFLAISGLFIFIIGSFVLSESRGWLVKAARLRLAWTFAGNAASQGDPAVGKGDGPLVGTARLLATVVLAAAAGYFVYVVSSRWLGSTIPFLAVLAVLAASVGLRRLRSDEHDAPIVSLVVAMVLVALALAIGLDVYRVEGDIDRMNSVFKFYLQIWVLLAVASAYMLWRLAYMRAPPLRRPSWGKRAWVAALAVLVLSSSVYPVLGTKDRLRDRFTEQTTPLTLDGTEYMRGTVYRDREGDIDLEADYQGILWLMNEVQGSPVVLEGHTPTYRWGGRVSVYTGLPSVVGWKWHQEQQRWDYRWAVEQRIQDVNRIYGTASVSEAMLLLERYDVEYVYVGQLERLYYPPGGLAKFEGGMREHLDRVFEGEQVTIYRVKSG
jgi:YYY domain-containing protein